MNMNKEDFQTGFKPVVIICPRCNSLFTGNNLPYLSKDGLIYCNNCFEKDNKLRKLSKNPISQLIAPNHQMDLNKDKMDLQNKLDKKDKELNKKDQYYKKELLEQDNRYKKEIKKIREEYDELKNKVKQELNDEKRKLKIFEKELVNKENLLIENKINVSDNDMFKYLLKKEREIKSDDIFKFRESIYDLDMDIINYYIENTNINLNIQNKYDYTVLMRASALGNIEIIKFLIRSGADVNFRNKNGFTALMTATEHGKIDVVKLLIEAGADLNIKNNYGKTAFDIAKGNNNCLTEFLLETAGSK